MSLEKTSMAYDLGVQRALEKVALNFSPLLTRALAGGALGAGMGALTAGEGNRGRGALMGGALGALGGGLTHGRASKAYGNMMSPEKMMQNINLSGSTPTQFVHGVHGAAGAGYGLLGGLAGGLGARATATPEPTWQDKLKALPGQAYQGMQSLLGG